MRSIILISFASGILAAGAAQAQEQCDRPAETVSAVQAPLQDLRGGEVLGRTAATCGNLWSAANLLEKANAARPTVTSRFNLAAAYVNIGRYEEAAALYRSTAIDGEYTNVVLDPIFGASFLRPTTVNIADESKRRLARIATLQSANQTASQPFTAAQAGVNAAERQPASQGTQVVADIASTTTVSNDEALTRDGLVTAKVQP